MKGPARIGFVLVADVVFLGKVLGRDPPAGSDEALSASEVTFTFAVNRVFKGHVAATQTVVSQGLAGFCGQTFPDNDSVLVFANDETERGGPQRYVSQLCSGSELADAAPPSFGAGKVPVGYVKPAPVAASGGSSVLLLLAAASAVVIAALGGGVFVTRRRRGERST